LTPYEAFHVTGWIQPATLGRVRVEVSEVTEIAALRAALKGENLTAGERITQLFIGNRLVMSDTYHERRWHHEIIRKAHGEVLVNGLGLGCVLRAILTRPEVTHVDVVEIEEDVLRLIGPYFAEEERMGRVTLHHADAYNKAWPRGVRWNAAWHDIWPDICVDDLTGHEKLSRRYGRRVDWQGCWAHHQLLYYRKRERY
jgi:hypothetical protein